MGKIKDLMIQMQSDAQGVQLARSLGISYEELTRLDYEIHENEGNDGLIYNYYVKFGDKSPNDILKKIKRLNNGIVTLEPHELDESDDDFYDELFEVIKSNKDYYSTYLREIK